MKGNIVLAAAVFAAGIIIASIILVFGIQSALNDAMLHLLAHVPECFDEDAKREEAWFISTSEQGSFMLAAYNLFCCTLRTMSGSSWGGAEHEHVHSYLFA